MFALLTVLALLLIAVARINAPHGRSDGVDSPELERRRSWRADR